MTPAARASAAITLLEQLLGSWADGKHTPADKLLEAHFKSNRYMGSKDRGAVAELTYWILRHKASLEWWIAKTFPEPQRPMLHARLLVLAALAFRGEDTSDAIFSGERYAPAPLTPHEKAFLRNIGNEPLVKEHMPSWVQHNYPEWLQAELELSFGDTLAEEMAALHTQAPVDLRANTLKTTRDELIEKLRAEQIEAEPSALSPVGIRLAKRAPFFASPLFKEGLFEMQDAGSQLVALAADAKPGQKVIDFCAGAGGKTLAMAASMQNKGRILALDTSANRMIQMKPRLKRAGVDNVQTHVIASEHDAFIKRHKQSADRVLVDAPCSGSGTWRRNPDLKWRFSENDLAEVTALQQRILQSAARLVKPRGRLIYATCSVLQRENQAQIHEFLKNFDNFVVVSMGEIWDKTPAGTEGEPSHFLRLTPHQDGVDGFFAAVLARTA